MCGRTACTLAPDDIQKACCYRCPKSKIFKKPEWRDVTNGGRSYEPTHNACPTDITPVLVSGSHFNMECDRIVQPMMWGIIPVWHKGDYKNHGLKTNNCRIENLNNSKLYKRLFVLGQRCAVVCDGFYEWQTTKGDKSKQPYFIFMPQDPDVKIEEPSTWNMEFNENFGWKGPRLLVMAGLFDIWKSPEDEEIFSYTIITMEANDTMSWLHHRMPAILSNEEMISDWLDYGHINQENALALIKPVKQLVWYPVSSTVNNSKNKDKTCNKPKKEESNVKQLTKGAAFMKSWLQGAGAKRNLQDSKNCNSKIPKTEPN